MAGTTANVNISSSARSQLENLKTLSFWGKLGLVRKLPVYYFLALFSTIFTSKGRRAPTAWLHFRYAFLRNCVSKLSLAQRHFVMPSDDAGFEDAAERHNATAFLHRIVVDGTTTFWVGSKDAKLFLVNLHGGGFGHPHAKEQIDYIFHAHKMFQDAGKDVAILSLAYDLAPVARYPRQLQQSVSLIAHLTQDLQISPSNIVLIGDSAGANLVLAVLSHITHPHPTPSIPRLDYLQQDPFRAAILVSAWISFRKDGLKSMEEFETRDIVSWPACCIWASAYLGTAYPYPNSDVYVQARDAPPEWWEGLAVREIRLLSGGEECLIDPIKEFTEKLKAGYGEERVLEEIVPRECHEAHYIWPGFGVHNSVMGKVSDQWLLELF